MTHAEERKLLNTVARHRFQDELRHARTRQGRFDAHLLHLDHPLPGTNVLLAPSDRGKGAAAIYARCEVEPLWLQLWRNGVSRLPQTGRRVLAALLEDWRSRPAARIAGVSKTTVDAWKKIFKVHFAPCFTAYKRNFVN